MVTLPPVANGFVLAGTVVVAEDGSRIPGAEIRLSWPGYLSPPVATGQLGRFQFDSVPPGTVNYRIAADGCFSRSSGLDISQSRMDAVFDVLCESPTFSRFYYNQLVRNAYEGSGRVRLSRWTTAPSFYVRTVTRDGGTAVDQATLDGVRRVIENSVFDLSGGRLRAAAIEMGPEDRLPRDGWVRVDFAGALPGGIDGQATAGPAGDAGFMLLGYGDEFEPRRRFPPDSGCESRTVEIADHEILHTMGFFHTRTLTEDFSSPGCTGLDRPARVGHHANLAYSRPFGNLYEDNDPEGFVTPLRRPAATQTVVSCRLTER